MCWQVGLRCLTAQRAALLPGELLDPVRRLKVILSDSPCPVVPVPHHLPTSPLLLIGSDHLNHVSGLCSGGSQYPPKPTPLPTDRLSAQSPRLAPSSSSESTLLRSTLGSCPTYQLGVCVGSPASWLRRIGPVVAPSTKRPMVAAVGPRPDMALRTRLA